MGPETINENVLHHNPRHDYFIQIFNTKLILKNTTPSSANQLIGFVSRAEFQIFATFCDFWTRSALLLGS